ncbi:MAG: hypothetical protein K5857_08770 [Lachnospiraceae bacterium]|nr:hypothetical protein [Lachnospiraceae bacterium]
MNTDKKRNTAKVLVTIPVIIVIITVIAVLVSRHGFISASPILGLIARVSGLISVLGIAITPFIGIIFSSIAIAVSAKSLKAGTEGARKLLIIAIAETVDFVIWILLFILVIKKGAGV